MALPEGYPRGTRPEDPEELSKKRSPEERPEHYDIDVIVDDSAFYRLANYNADSDTVEVCMCCAKCGPETLPWSEVDAWRYEYCDKNS